MYIRYHLMKSLRGQKLPPQVTLEQVEGELFLHLTDDLTDNVFGVTPAELLHLLDQLTELKATLEDLQPAEAKE
jgi:hypothetical protein